MAFTTTGSNLIINGSFEDLTGLTTQAFGATGNGSIVGWTSPSGVAIDIHTDERNGIAPTDGVAWLDTAASPTDLDVEQTIAGLTAGAVYQLQFDLGTPVGNPDTVEVYWGGDLIATIDPATTVLQTLNFSFVGGAGDGSNTLAFVGTNGDDNDGASIDNVQFALVIDAIDDTATVTESEGAGDTDLTALSNDDGSDIAVTAVNGSGLNVGASVAGSNGGTFVIDSEGNVDFDAGTDFDDLGVNESEVTTVTYTISAPQPFDEGAQSTQTSGGVGPSDQTAFFTFDAQEFTNDGTTDISGTIDLSGITQPTYNILFVMDVSGSTVFTNPSFPGAGDQNGDGDSNEVIDAEILALRELSTEIDALGFSDADLQIGFVTFDTLGDSTSDTEIVLEGTDDQQFNAGSSALSDAINVGPGVSGGTDFEAALQQAILWFETQAANGDSRDNNIIYFLSDGEHNGGAFSDEVTNLETNFGAEINGIGISSGANLTQLNQLDNTNGAERVENLAQLDAALAPPFLDAAITDFRLFVDGVEDTSIDVNDLTQQGTGFIINPQAIAGLTTTTNSQSVIEAEIEFDDGTVLRNTVTVQTQAQDTATISVTVTGENDAPVAVDDAFSGDEDTLFTGSLLDNDSDVDGDNLTTAVGTPPANGDVTVNPDGTFEYTPDPDFNGTDTFTYVVSDGNGGSDVATVTLTVNPVNDAPVALDDVAEVTESNTLNFDVLENDSDIEGDTLTIVSANAEPTGTPFTVISDGGRTGTVTVSPDGATQVTFEPADGSGPTFEDLAVGETDIVEVTYLVTDGNGGNDVATLTITVTGENDAPVAQADFVTGLEDNPITGNVLANDEDVDGDQLTATLGTPTVNGDVVLNPNGTFTYTPDPDFVGQDTFTYTVSDGNGGTDTQTVTLTVGGDNDAPEANPDAVTADEDTPLTIPASTLLANDTDVDNDPLTIISVNDALSTGVVTLNGTDVVYDPNGQFEDLAVGETATDTFTYTVSDGQGGTAITTVTVTIDGVNDAPVPEDDTASGQEDTPITGNVLTNDTDPDGDPLIATLGTPPANGDVLLNPDGSFSYTPDPDFNGTDTFTYVADDGNGGTVTETVTVTIDPVNDAPVAAPDAVTGDEDSPITGNVLDNDEDVDGDPLTATLGTPPTNGTVVVNPDGSFEYTPDPDFNGTDTFTYVATDPSGTTSVETVTVTVDPVNDDPVAEADFFTGLEDNPITGDVLTNDSDVDGDTLTVLTNLPPANGDLVLNPDGTFTYTPDDNFNGTDTFTYTVLDGNGGTDTATVTLTVGGDNDAPVAAPDTATTDEDTALTIPATDLLANDTDEDGDTLTIINVGTVGTVGTVVLNGTDVVYDPNGQFEDLATGETATDTFTYTVSDGNGGTDTETVTVTITGANDAPVAAPDTATGDEDSPITGNVLTNDADPDGDPLIASLGTPPANGDVVVNPDGSFEYTPDPDFNGTDTFTYVATDPSGTTSVETVTVTVTPVNDAPVAVDDDITFATESVTSVIEPLLNDTDVDGDALTVQSFDGSGLLGTLQRLGPNTNELFYETNGAFESLAEGETAIETFTYVIADPSGATDTATVTLTITGENDTPIAVSDTAEVSEDDTAPTTIDLTANDVDPDDTDDLQIDSIDTSGTQGTVVINPDNDTVDYDPNGQFEFLGVGESAVDTFTYTVVDPSGATATAAVSVTITGENDAPVALDDVAEVTESNTLNFDVLENDSDIEGDTLTIVSANAEPTGTPFTVISDGGRTGTVTVSPDGATQVTFEPADGSGPTFEDLAVGETDIVEVTYLVTDGNGGNDVATLTITVTGENDAPVAQADFVTGLEDNPITGNVLANDEDVDGDQLTATLGTPTVNGDVVLNPNGTFTYTPDPDFVGQDTFTYTVSDGNGGTDTQTVTLTVGGDNDAPEANPDAVTADEDTPLTIPASTLLANDTDVDNDPLTIISVNDALSTGVVTLNGTDVVYDPNGQFEDLAVGETATDTFTYTVSDGQGGTAITTVTVTIDGVNDAPVPEDDTASGQEDTPITGNVLTNDTDPDGDPLIATLGTPPANGDVLLNPDGSFSYTPDPDFNGTDTFTYVADDGNGGTVTETVTVTIDPVNDAPVAAPDAVTGDEDSPITGNVLDNDEDVDGDPLTATLGTPPTNGTVVVNPDGSFEYTPDPDFNGTDTFTYVATDPSGTTSVETVTVTVDPVNDDPVAEADFFTGLEDNPITGDVLTNDSDVDGDTLTVLTNLPPANGDLVLNPDGTFTYTPDDNFNGTDTFTYTVLDGNGGTDTATVTLTVGGDNDAPVAAPDTATTDEDTALTIPATDLLANDTDEDGDTLTIINVGTVGTVGTVVLNGTDVVYDPNGQFEDLATGETATDTFTYTVSDGNGGTDTETVTVTITGANDAPVAAPDTATGDEDSPITGNVLTNDADPDGDPLIASLGTPPANGDVVVNPDGSFEYTPDPDFNGTDTFTYVATDPSGTTSVETVTVTVTPVNDAPVAVDDDITFATESVTSVIEPLLNDTDVDGDALTVQSFDGSGLLGTLQRLGPNTNELFYETNGAFESLAEGETAIETFTYVIADPSGATDTATVTLTITGENDTPIAVSDTAEVSEDDTAPTTIDLTANDVDPDDTDDLQIDSIDTSGTQGTVVINPDNDTVDYDPNGQFEFLGVGESAVDTFTYTVVDPSGATATAAVSVTITGENDAPVALDDVAEVTESNTLNFDVLENDSDIEGDTLTIVSANAEPTGTPFTVISDGGRTGTVTVSPDGATQVTFEPADGSGPTFEDLAVGETDIVEVTYLVTDGNGGNDVATLTITVTGENDAPVAQADFVTGLEDNPITGNVLANDEDVDGDQLTATLGTPTVNGDVVLNPNGTFTYTPDPDFVGQDTFTYTVSDGNGGTDTQTVTLTVGGDNDAPEANPDAVTADEDTPLTIPASTLLANDTDVDNDPLTIISVNDALSTGVVTLNGTDVVYDPNGQFEDLAVGETATDTFTYTVSDGQGGTAITTVTVTIDGVNDAPVPEDDTASGQEDTPITGNVLTNDTDPDGDPLIATLGTPPANGDVLLNPDGSFSYTPDPDFNGTDTFTYVADDGNGGTVTETVTVTIDPVNDAPVAAPDAVTGDEDSPITGNVLDNDEDVDGDPLTATLGTPPTNGTVVVNPDGSFEYTPDPDFNGTDTFTYVATDPSGTTSVETVTVTVDPVNDDPVAEADFFTGLEDNPITGDVLTNDSDVDGDTLTVLTNLPPANGDLVLNPDGTFTYTPDDNFNGTDTFTYTVLDGNGGTDTATVTLTVGGDNDAPVAAPDTATTDEDTALTIPATDLLANDTDEDGDTLTIINVGTVGTVGTVVLNGTDVVYDPNGQFEDLATGETATDTFTYTVSDGNGGTDTETVTVTITGANDAPVAAPDTATGDEDSPITGNVLTNDADPDGDPLIASLGTPPANGDVVVNPDGSFEYTPDPDFNGTDTFTYVATDPSGTTSVETVTVTVTPVNDAPVAVDDDITFATESVTSVIEPLLNDTDVDGDALTVQSFDGSGLLGTLQRLGPNTNELFYETNGAFESLAEGETAIETFTYVIADPSGATDTATVTLTITGENDTPIAVSDTAEVSEDDTAPTTIDLTANDVDPDDTDDLQIDSIDTSGTQGTVVINPDNDTVDYDPNGQFEFLGVGESAVDTFTYTVVDPSGATATAAVSVTITGENDAPVALDDVVSVSSDAPTEIDVLDNDTDPDEDPLTITDIDDTGLLGTVSIDDNGTPLDPTDDFIIYDPGTAFDGLGQGEEATETFTYTVTDPSGATSTATVTVTINGLNDAPTAEDDTAVVNQAGTVDIDVLANDTDQNAGDVLTVINFTQGLNGTVEIDPLDGSLIYTPDRQFPGNDEGLPGTDTFTYTISDGRGGQDTATVTVQVNANIPPFIPEPIRFEIPENQVEAADLQAIDIEFDLVTFSIAGTGDDDALFEMVDPINGLLNFRSPPDFETPLSADGDNEYFIDVTVSDEFGSRTQTIEVNVIDVDDTPNTPPTITGPDLVFITSNDVGVIPGSQFVAEDLDGDTLQFTLFGQDANTDVDPNTPGIQPLFTVDPINGFLILNERQTDPRGSFDGDSIFEVDILVEDGNGGSAVQEIDLLLITGA